MVLLAVSRVLAQGGSNPSKFRPFVTLSAVWSGSLLTIASEGGIDWQARSHMD
eukprot:CAMPEP_0118664094 /NCGR_PEP_ID=MMETSP0785-20121206/17810_1 /TAXON_ID=91992 /ORGANISM="Bolidomonas pacifica, Strain CCMP 1866" /LENGTH=52 /DNA_ID=CAMNT_0006557939 /DNA_START=198 /DNA_END=353 /DNA_ORIENTATION=+